MTDPVGAVAEIRGIHGLLSKLFRIVILENPREAAKMSTYAKAYLNAKRETILKATGSDAKHLNQGALFRDLGNSEMTLKTWIKGMRVLPVLKIKFSVEITWKSNRVTVHTAEGIISDEEDDDDDKTSDADAGYMETSTTDTTND
jgi:hypothetical protein